jgi:hypothetical protein
LYSIVEFAPMDIVGVFVLLIAVVAAPEKPFRLAVLKVPLMVAVPEVP